ncbi:MAG: TetR/AcrR family transcriptional regulator, partial [Actinobacteria bacterium]|nr:TetR/AcrR family transcriptional regulator [Actinomycetota bacterium]
MSTMESPESQQSREAILKSARHEIERAGILGLRVADVASGANSSITQIYRFFKNRDGLLARVLGDMYDESTENAVEYFKTSIADIDPLTVDAIVAAIPYQLSP